MANVTHTLTLPGGGTPAKVNVTVELVASTGRPLQAGHVTATDTAVAGVLGFSSTTGTWTKDLAVNADITPANTYYRVVEWVEGGPAYTHTIRVTGAGNLADMLVDPPASLATAGSEAYTDAELAAHAAAADPHPAYTTAAEVQAAAVGGDLTGTIGNAQIAAGVVGLAELAASAKPVVNVMDPAYGAVGDGAADDTAAVQAAIAGGAGRVVQFPAGGTYRLTGNVNVTTSGTILDLTGATILAAANVIPITFTGTVGTPLTGVGVRGGTIDLDLVAGSGIKFTYCDDPVVHDTFVRDGLDPAGGAVIFQNCNRPRALAVGANTVGTGVLFNASPGGAVIGGAFSSMRRDGVLVYAGSDDVTVLSCVVKGYNTAGENGRAGIHGYGVDRLAVTGTVVDCGAVGGSSDSPKIRFRDVEGFACAGNHVTGSSGAGIAVVALSDVGNRTGKGAVTGNTIRDVGGLGVSITVGGGGVAADVDPITIVGNTIINAGGGITATAGTATVIASNYIEGVNAEGVVANTKAAIVGNVIRNVGQVAAGSRAGIFVTGGTATVVGNHIVDDQGTATMVDGLRIIAGATANTVANTITGYTTSAIRNDGTITTLVGEHSTGRVGFYGTTPIAKQTGVAVTAAAIHAALVNLGLIAA